MRISDVAIPNPNNTPNSDLDFINYLDTGSCTRNEITGIQKLFKGEFPSRAKRVVKNDDVIISTVRPNLCHYAILKDTLENMVVSTGFTVLTAKENIIPEYLYFFLTQKNVTDRLSVIADGATTSYPSINPEHILNLEINLPDKKEQRKISDILSVIDQKISLNNRIINELESMAKTIYNYWFVQFDFPNEEGKPYKASGGEMEWNEELKREIPVGWDKECLPNIADITTGNLDSNAEVCDGKYLFFTCAAEPTRTNTFEFEGDAILIAGNNASANFHVNRYCGKFNAYQRTYVVSAKEKLNLEYLYQLLRNQMLLLKAKGQGSQTKFITIDMLNNIVFSKVPEIIMVRFNELISPLYRKQMNLFSETQELITLRDFLLPLLMNRQVRVK